MSNQVALPTHTELILRALRRFPDRVAFRQGSETWSYTHTADVLARTVSVLRDHGLRAGGGIGLLSPNRPEAWIAQAAPGFLGASYTALHPLGSLDDHLLACDEAELRILLVDPAYAERGAALLERAPSIEHVLSLGPGGPGPDLIALQDKADRAPIDDVAVDPETIHWLLYTGGTTGVPKAVELPERAVAQMAMSTAVGWDLPHDRHYLAVSPVSHAAGMMITSTLLAGGSVSMMKGWDPEEWVATVETNGITVSLLVPTMIYSLLDSVALDRARLARLQTIMYGASPMAPARLREGLERIGPVFCQLYGQTECAGIITSLWRHQHSLDAPERFASCGQAMPGVRVSLLDEDNQPVANGDAGEICVQGPNVMKGYLGRPELTAETMSGGVLHTGDIGVRDDEGFFYLVDRKKDMIVSGGFNVFPSEIERILAEHPEVAAAAVIGVPHPKWGEAVKAVVVARPGLTPDAGELIALVRERKGSHYAPKSVDFIDALPVTPVGKPDKRTSGPPIGATRPARSTESPRPVGRPIRYEEEMRWR